MGRLRLIGDWFREWFAPAEEERSISTVDDYFTYLGMQYPLGLGLGLQSQRNEQPAVAHSYAGYADGVFKGSGPVYALEQVRVQVFSAVRFQFQALEQGRPTRLFGTPELDLLNEPFGPDTVQDLLTLQLLTADLAGTCYHRRAGRELEWLRPDWIDVVLAERDGMLARQRIGYLYWPNGDRQGKATPLALEDVAAFSPMPDPLAPYRGMSWLTPVIREVQSDNAARDHKRKFFENGAVPGLFVSLKETVSKEDFKEFVEIFAEKHQGVENAYKTLVLGGGADVTVVGADFKQIDFKTVQGAGETRLASAAGVPAIIVGFSEGLQGSSLNAGNYGMARRRFADGTMHPLWQKSAGSFQNVVRPPAGSRLWYDGRDVPFLREDAKDAAEIFGLLATAMRTLVDGGFNPDAVVDAVDTLDVRRLVKNHTGMVPVQLQKPGAEKSRALRAVNDDNTELEEAVTDGRTA